MNQLNFLLSDSLNLVKYRSLNSKLLVSLAPQKTICNFVFFDFGLMVLSHAHELNQRIVLGFFFDFSSLLVDILLLSLIDLHMSHFTFVNYFLKMLIKSSLPLVELIC